MIKMELGKATIEDIPELNKLVQTCYRDQESLKGWTSEAKIIDGCRTTPEMLKREMTDPDATIFKLTNDSGKIIACVYTLKKSGNKMHSGMLCVLPTLQSNGIGKKLMGVVEAYAVDQKCNVLKIDVISIRDSLIAWYEKLGFKRTGESHPFPPPTFGVGIAKIPLELMVMEKILV